MQAGGAAPFHMRALSEICRASHTAAARRAALAAGLLFSSRTLRAANEYAAQAEARTQKRSINLKRRSLTVRRASSRDFAAAAAAAGTVVFYVTRL
jgi:hypothetical protein